MVSIILTILALGLVIFIHELAHLIAAKLNHIEVYEFSLGMGPKIYSFPYKQTIYSLRIFPIGGFIRISGMDDNETEQSNDQNNFYKKPFFAKFLTIAAGSIGNILLGFILLFSIFFFMGIMQPTPIIDKVMPNSPAAKAGLIPHDKILAINNHPINDLDKDFVQIVNQATGKTINITILRQNQQHIINIIPKDLNNSKIGRIGISFNGEITKYNIPLSCVYSFKTTLLNIKFVFQSFKMLINHQVGLKDMAGPIGIVQIASSQLQKGFIYFLNIMAVISISLGIVNLLPFPALDGGHLLFLLIEFILRKPLNPKILTYINQISMAILITLMVLIIFNDIINWGTRVSLLNKL